MSITVLSLEYLLGALVVWSAGLFISFLLYLCYLHKIHDHLPGPPRSSFILGHVPALMQYKQSGRTRRQYFLDNRMQYGPIFVIFLVYKPLVIIGDPADIKKAAIDLQDHLYRSDFFYHRTAYTFGERALGRGLVTNSDNQSWHKRRQLMNPAFHRKRLKEFITDFNEVCDKLIKRIKAVAESKQEVSMLKEFANATLDIISQVSFHISLGSIEDPESPFPKAFKCFTEGLQANVDSPLSPTLLSIFRFRIFQTATQKKQIEATKFLRKFAFECINKRLRDIKDGKHVPNDLLGLLINDKTLSMDDIIDEFVTVFVAGREPTANHLAFTLYEIIKNPKIEAKILKEVEEVMGGKDYVDFEDLGKLKYLGQVLQESLRRHTVAAGPFKTLTKEVEVAGYQIPIGTAVAYDGYVFSHSPDIWKNPDIFDPERFEAPEKIPNFSTVYFPFSLGPHTCFGQNVAKFESKVILARLLPKFQFTLLPGQTDAVEERLAFAPRDGVICRVTER